MSEASKASWVDKIRDRYQPAATDLRYDWNERFNRGARQHELADEAVISDELAQRRHGGELTYSELAPLARSRADEWVQRAVGGITTELVASASWGEQVRDAAGRGWEKLQADSALRLAAIAAAPWNRLSLAEAQAAFLAAAPVGGRWTPRDRDYKWRSQIGRGQPVPVPTGVQDAVAHPEQSQVQVVNPSDLVGDAEAPQPRRELDAAAELEAREIAAEARRLRIREAARRVVAAERRGDAEPFDAGTLAEVLGRPPEPVARVEGLLPWDSSILVTAQRKTGKTTLMLNLARCLLTGEDLLGRFPVRAVAGTVAVLNFEVSGRQLARWAADVGVPADRLLLVNLRGRRNPLGDPQDRQRLSALLKAAAVESVICDPFGRAYTGTSQNDAGEVQAFLVTLDEFVRSDLGAKDLVLTAHAGWNGERTRGSSALEDWADVFVTLTSDESGEHRYLRALGRDVEVDEDRLSYDANSRTLTLAGAGSRKAAGQKRREDDLRAAEMRIIGRRPGLSAGQIEVALREEGIQFQKGQERKMLHQLIEEGAVRIEPGTRGTKHHFLATGSPTLPRLPDPPRGEPGDRPHHPYRGGDGPGATQPDHPRGEGQR